MHENGLLEPHEQMTITKDHFSARDHVDSSLFDPYGELAAEPSHVHKSKSGHKRVVFVLDNALTTATSDNEFSSVGRIGRYVEKLVDDAEGKI